MHPCSFPHAAEAVGRVLLTEGCLAYPEAGLQDLCLHHWTRCSPRGYVAVLATYVLPDEAARLVALLGATRP